MAESSGEAAYGNSTACCLRCRKVDTHFPNYDPNNTFAILGTQRLFSNFNPSKVISRYGEILQNLISQFFNHFSQSILTSLNSITCCISRRSAPGVEADWHSFSTSICSSRSCRFNVWLKFEMSAKICANSARETT